MSCLAKIPQTTFFSPRFIKSAQRFVNGFNQIQNESSNIAQLSPLKSIFFRNEKDISANMLLTQYNSNRVSYEFKQVIGQTGWWLSFKEGCTFWKTQKEIDEAKVISIQARISYLSLCMKTSVNNMVDKPLKKACLQIITASSMLKTIHSKTDVSKAELIEDYCDIVKTELRQLDVSRFSKNDLECYSEFIKLYNKFLEDMKKILAIANPIASKDNGFGKLRKLTLTLESKLESISKSKNLIIQLLKFKKEGTLCTQNILCMIDREIVAILTTKAQKLNEISQILENQFPGGVERGITSGKDILISLNSVEFIPRGSKTGNAVKNPLKEKIEITMEKIIGIDLASQLLSIRGEILAHLSKENEKWGENLQANNSAIENIRKRKLSISVSDIPA